MKNRILLFAAALLAVTSLRATTLVSLPTSSSDPAHSAVFAGLDITSVDQLLELTPDKYRALTGKKLTLKERIGLKLAKKEIRKQLKRNGEMNVEEAVAATSWNFNILAFLLGLILGILGLLLALLFEDRRSALISAGIGMAIWLVAILVFGVL